MCGPSTRSTGRAAPRKASLVAGETLRPVARPVACIPLAVRCLLHVGVDGIAHASLHNRCPADARPILTRQMHSGEAWAGSALMRGPATASSHARYPASSHTHSAPSLPRPRSPAPASSALKKRRGDRFPDPRATQRSITACRTRSPQPPCPPRPSGAGACSTES